ncbi:ATP-binding protein [Usitatibacter palustris]|uniref:histidine kinase n=1 Tax=Usitatibacter palustris TaxID=2732487 RepID=A0A6M4HCE4_9PROT|nr:ATP-binding protein [Usitatibacter palustris]QJR16253.1 Sensor protein QseC [Usitatibacter palustris]
MPRPDRSAPSLRGRLLGLLVGGALGAWVLIAIATYFDARFHTARMLDAQLVEYSEVLGAIASHEALEVAGATTRHDPAYVQNCTYQVFSLEGNLLLRSHDAPNASLAPAEGFSDVNAAGVDWRAFRRTDRHNGVVIIVAHGVADRDELVRGLAMRLMVPLAVGLPLLAIALWLAVARALRPLEQLAREVRSREPGHLAAIAAPDVPSEVEPLVTATNQLFARLERAFENERRFTGDAAHELRTPLAALRTQAEVALTTTNDERRCRALGQVVDGVERATRVVEQMLTLARMDAGDALPAFAKVDIAEICREVILEVGGDSRDRGVGVLLDAQSRPLVPGDPVMLLALLRNLLDNALRFAPDGGQVRVSVTVGGDRARVTVEDSGPGVAPDVGARIFDRFYRGPDGRGPGSGLGLSIASRVVELHGGSIAASRSPALGGLRIEISLPAPP